MMMLIAVAAPVDQFAVCGLQSIDLAFVGQQLEVAVDGGQSNRFSIGP
jgi:hypothetical protein